METEINKAKEFDAVDYMRQVRDKLGEKYFNDTEMLLKELKKIQKKFNMKVKKANQEIIVYENQQF